MLLVLITSTAVGLVAFTGVALSGSVGNTQAKALRNEQSKWVLTGAETLAKSDLFSKKVALGATQTYTIAGQSVTVNFVDNSASMTNTVKLVFNGSANGSPIASSTVVAIAKPVITTIWSHGIYSNGGFTWPAASKVTGSVYFRNSISILSLGGTISQDFKTSSMFNPTGLITVGGGIMTGVSAYTWPAVNSTTYSSKADSTLTGDQTLSGYTFPKQNAIVVVNGNLKLTNAQITRSGTFFVTGTVTVDHVTRAKSSDHFAVICPNGITFANGANTVTAEGYFFSGATITLSSPLALTGAMIGNTYSGNKAFNVTWDQWIMADPANGKALLVPGL